MEGRGVDGRTKKMTDEKKMGELFRSGRKN